MPRTGQNQDSSQIEYSIYTFDYPDARQKGADKWTKQATLFDMATALKKAEQLSKTKKFKKVEVKQKYFDKKRDRDIDTVLRVFESKKDNSLGPVGILFFAVLCGAAAFGITVYLSQ